MREELRELWRYRELLLILVQRDLKVRYKNSVLGFGWSLINPLVQVLTITVVVKYVLQVDIENYHAYVFCAILPWTFFSTTVMDGTLSVAHHYNLIRRTYFPRVLLPLASVTSNTIHFLMATGVFLVWMSVVPVFWWAWTGEFNWAIQPTALLLPLIIAALVLLVAGITMLVSVWTLYFEDVRFLLDNGLKILQWLVPVLYFADIIRHSATLGAAAPWVYRLYMLNPLAALITAFRKLTLPMVRIVQRDGTVVTVPPMTGEDLLFLGIALLVSAGIAAAGYRYFDSRKWKLAERP